jgi:bifunctional DNA-binding transcriptional regulator/antitoxin component of YhaV-PrlF toxin-antitoxin module
MRFVKRVAGNGHVTVPADLRSALTIESGDIIEFEVLGILRTQTSATGARLSFSTPATS